MGFSNKQINFYPKLLNLLSIFIVGASPTSSFIKI